MSTRSRKFPARGFTLVEVMVALIVISVGLLGIASMQGLAVSASNGSRQRSLAALEAASLSASMHVDRLFWLANGGPTTITVSGNTITVSGGTGGLSAAVGAAPACAPTGATTAPACTPDLMAAYDLIRWAASVSALLPNPVSTITCGGTNPLSCTIDMKWIENSVAANKQEAAIAASSPSSSPAGFENTEYTLYVEP